MRPGAALECVPHVRPLKEDQRQDRIEELEAENDRQADDQDPIAGDVNQAGEPEQGEVALTENDKHGVPLRGRR